MSQKFCLILYHDVPDKYDDELSVEAVASVDFMEERNHVAAVAAAHEQMRGYSRATLVSVLDVTEIDFNDEEPRSELDELRATVEELESKADGFDVIMGVIKDFAGTDPRDVGPSQKKNPMFGQAESASLEDVAINLLHEAVRKKAEEMSK